ncbi:MAG TPA: NAD-dependent deacylase [Acidobacteriota bacterium]|nr:NAD-dependent deacylase [Acidobacteriota bacterium]
MPVPSIPEAAIAALSSAEAVAAFTGAGISAESGVPTFRGERGLWRTYRPEELATPQAFEADPRTVWEWYTFRRDLMAKSNPNPGHYALARWERHFPHFSLVTQNVDGLHHRAGSQVVYELHGNICRSRCHWCRKPAGDLGVGPDGELPHCACGGPIRPDVVWFGETLPARTVDDAWKDVRQTDVFVSVGTSSIVYPAAGLIEIARSAGAFMIEVNPEETELSGLFDVCLRGPSGIILPEVSRRLGLAD